MPEWLALLLALLLLAGNAFFVGAEFAVISARRDQIEPRARAGSKRARLTLRSMEHVSLMLACTQLGITVCSLGLGGLGEPALSHLVEGPLAAAGAPSALTRPVGFVLALLVVTSLHMVLGEMVPKNVAIAGPGRAALLLTPPLYAISRAVRPVIAITNGMANLTLRLARVQPQDEVSSSFDADQVAGMVDQSRREGLLDDTEHDLLAGALTLPEERVAGVVIPIEDVVSAPAGASVTDLEQLCISTGFSRFPLAGPDRRFTGYVHVKDLLDVPLDQVADPVPQHEIRKLVTLACDRSLREALATMQASGAHLAMVMDGDPDDRGSRPVGMAALEDVLERLVGEVVDSGQQTG